tara:strand:+ start:30 stop:665 length:636 start_codon:yes stop_codon:yes gene_type:complete
MSEEEIGTRNRLAKQIRARREKMESDELRRSIASKLKPISLAASITPYDLGLGDIGYAAGELIDPEGNPKTAALAAGMGLITGGLGSGAVTATAAKKLPKVDDAAYRETKKKFETFIKKEKDSKPNEVQIKDNSFKEFLDHIAEAKGPRYGRELAYTIDMAEVDSEYQEKFRDLLFQSGVLYKIPEEKNNDGYITDSMIMDQKLMENMRQK